MEVYADTPKLTALLHSASDAIEDELSKIGGSLARGQPAIRQAYADLRAASDMVKRALKYVADAEAELGS